MIEVAKKHSDAIGPSTSRRRIRQLYRELIVALIAENKLTEARERMREFALWDKGGIVTMCQRFLLRLSPRNFDNISRQCLYRTEWHITNLINKLRSQN
jgi:hypothetical protein